MTSNLQVTECKNYEGDYIYNIIEKYFDDYPDQKEILKKSKEVLIKPNLCLPHSPDKAITTHPVIVEQIIKYALNNGAIPVVGENPIGDVKESDFTELIKITGMYDVLKKYNCKYILLGQSGVIEKTFLVSNKTYQIPVSKEYLDAEYVINVPKFKTHGLTGFTGAIKNIFGIIRGKHKACLHTLAKSIDDFSETLIKIYAVKKPELTVMDAIEGLSGNGPGTKGNMKKISLFLIGNDGLLMDEYCSQLLGFSNEEIRTNYYGKKILYEKDRNEKITYYNYTPPQQLKLKDFELPSLYTSNNLEVRDKLYELHKYRIKINYDKCESCYLCLDNCPKECIKDDGSKIFVDQENCILCLCCMEICPHGAIDISMVRFYNELKR